MKTLKILRYAAIILGFQASAFFSLFLITIAGTELIDGKARVIPILIMMIFSVSGYIWAVYNSVKGSLVMISGGAIMAIYLMFMGGSGKIEIALIYGLPFIVPGALFYYTSFKARTEIKEF